MNIGILAHVDAGKTTLTESMLLCGGVVSSAGRVDEGTTITDSMELERKRGITIRSASVSLVWKDTKINLLDTPGHMDFIAEVERALRVLDGAVLVISAKEGVQVQTRLLFQALARLKIPTVLYVNKLDRSGVELEAVHSRIRELLTPRFTPLQRVTGLSDGCITLENTPPGRASLRELLLNTDGPLGDRFLSELPLTDADYAAAFRRCVQSGELFPLLYGAAIKGVGTEALLDAVTGLLPHAAAGQAERPLRARVFQILRDEKLGRLACLKLTAGRIALRDTLAVPGAEVPLKVRRLHCLEQGRIIPAETVPAGDIALLAGTPELKIGMTLGEGGGEACPLLGHPTLEAAVSARSPGDRSRLIEALDELSDEDPFLASAIDPVSGEITVRLFGEVQLEILSALIQERYGLAAAFGPLATIYRERPCGAAEGLIPIYAWPNPYYAGIGLRVEPLPPGSGLQYETEVSYGYLTVSFQTAVREGVEKAGRRGLRGWELTDLKVTLYTARYDSVMSAPADFRRLAPHVLAQALRKAGTQLLEPMLRYTLRLPSGCGGRAAFDLREMRGVIERMEPEGPELVLSGRIPAQTCARYPMKLSAYTNGLGVFLTQPDGFGDYPGEPVNRPYGSTEEDARLRFLFERAGL